MAISLNIFNYSDYRSFIKDWLEAARKEKSFNLSKLAEVIQVHPTFLSQVLSGSKDLSLEQAAFMGRHLRFTRLEQELFFALIQLERAGTELLKEYWQERKKEIEAEKNKLSQRFEKHRELTNEQRALFYSSWIYAATWSASAIDGGQTAAQISDLFKISLNKSEEILNFLVQCGLCKEVQGLFSPGEMHIHVPNESPFVVRHHSNWRIKSIQKMDNREKSELFFTAPVSISKKDFDIIREKLNFAIADIVEVAKDSPAEEVVCLNIDFFRAL